MTKATLKKIWAYDSNCRLGMTAGGQERYTKRVCLQQHAHRKKSKLGMEPGYDLIPHPE